MNHSNPKKLSREEVEDEIKEIFNGRPTLSEIKKAKRLSKSKNIKLGILKRKFCKKCLSFFHSSNHEIRVKGPFKIIRCKNCGFISRYKIN